MEEIQLRIFCLTEALKYIGNTNKGVGNVVEVAKTFEAYLTGSSQLLVKTPPPPETSGNVIQFPIGVLQ